MNQAPPLLFDEFFESGLKESVSPFLTRQSRRWARNIPLKASLISSALLGLAFAFSFIHALHAISYLLLALVYFLAGIPKLIDSIEDLLNLEVNIDVLMTLAAFLSVLIGSAMEGALLLVLFSISGSIEEVVTSKAKSAVRTLHELAPSTVYVLNGEGEVTPRHVRDVAVGMHILIKAGQVVPLDGRVIAGSSSINQAHLTGEAMPVQKVEGDEVSAGATNLEGALTLEVIRTSTDSTIARMIQLITQAQGARPRLQRWLDRLNRAYAMGIIGFSLVLAITLPWLSSLPYLGGDGSIYRALAFLIAASPCALVIALPVAYLSAIGACARSGALLKGGITLDALARCKAIAFDKTGTLTCGRLEFMGIEAADPNVETGVALAAGVALEHNATHPIAASLTRSFKGILPTVLRFRSIPGYGVEGQVLIGDRSHEVYVGHVSYLGKEFSHRSWYNGRIEELQHSGHQACVLLFDQSLFLLTFKDQVRSQSRAVLQELRDRLNLRLFMLTGDHEANARQVSREVGIEEYYADLRPEDKLEHVARLAPQGLAMVGDGINDAPALARATVGISLGKIGSGTAIEASDIVLLHDNLQLLPWLKRKALATVRIVRQNVALAFLAILVASVSALIGLIPLWLAVVLHEGGTVLVGLNGLRLLGTAKVRHHTPPSA